MLTKEECMKALDDIKMLGSIHIPLESLDLIEQLINEHFNPQPYKFDDFNDFTNAFDSKINQLCLIKNSVTKSHIYVWYFCEKKAIQIRKEDFEENRFFHVKLTTYKEVEDDEARESNNIKHEEELLRLTSKEKEMINKALDYYGDKLADSQGYSSGEKYWNLANKMIKGEGKQ